MGQVERTPEVWDYFIVYRVKGKVVAIPNNRLVCFFSLSTCAIHLKHPQVAMPSTPSVIQALARTVALVLWAGLPSSVNVLSVLEARIAGTVSVT